MACWVVPTIAAELWGISVEQVTAAIREGRAATKQEHGFTLVDVAPNSPQIEAPRKRPEDRPASFVSLTADELIALHVEADAAEVDDEEEADSGSTFDYRAARAQNARERRKPACAVA